MVMIHDADDEFDYYDDANNHYAALSPWVTVEPCVGIIWTIMIMMLTMNLIIMMMLVIIMLPCLHGLLLNPVSASLS